SWPSPTTRGSAAPVTSTRASGVIGRTLLPVSRSSSSSSSPVGSPAHVSWPSSSPRRSIRTSATRQDRGLRRRWPGATTTGRAGFGSSATGPRPASRRGFPAAKWGYWDTEAALVPAAYVAAVERAGGRPLLVPPSDEAIAETLDALDGLLFSGGSDLDPELYDQEPHEQTFGVHPDRDRAELALLEAALARDMPVLAVCRGSQVLNIARGGDLVQHLPD